jgi:hypothetical protein
MMMNPTGLAPKQPSLSQQRRANPGASSSQQTIPNLQSNQNSANQQQRVMVQEKLKKKMQGSTRT